MNNHRLRARATGRTPSSDSSSCPKNSSGDDVARNQVEDVVRVVARERRHARSKRQDHRRRSGGVAKVSGRGASSIGSDDRGAHDASIKPALGVQLRDQVLCEVLGQSVRVGEAQGLDDGFGLFGGELGGSSEEHRGRLRVREDGAVGHDERVDGLLDVLA